MLLYKKWRPSMSINNFQQKSFLLNKIGLGRPQTRAEVLGMNKNPSPITVNPNISAPKPNPVPQPKKPGCSRCSRRKQQQQQRLS